MSYYIIIYWLSVAKDKTKESTKELLCWQWNMACHKDGTLLPSRHIALRMTDDCAWSLLEACGSWGIMWTFWAFAVMESVSFSLSFSQQLFHIWHWCPLSEFLVTKYKHLVWKRSQVWSLILCKYMSENQNYK